MAKALQPIEHEDRLSLVEHLDELRSRLIISLIAIAVAFAVCFWQNKRLLAFLAKPVKKVLNGEAHKGLGPAGQSSKVTQAVINIGHALKAYARSVGVPGNGASPAVRQSAASLSAHVDHAIAGLHQAPTDTLYTFTVGEPFTVSVTVCMYFSILVAMPVILFQIYAFVLPAFSPRERAVALPIMLAVPGLLVGGAAFGYYIVLPAATHFLLGFNASQFNVIVQANSYYPFAALIMVAMGLIFQLPILRDRAHARGNPHNPPAAQEPAHRGGGRRGHRGAAARRRDHDGSRDAADHHPLRDQHPYLAILDLRDRRRARAPVVAPPPAPHLILTRTTTSATTRRRCCLTFVAAAGGA